MAVKPWLGLAALERGRLMMAILGDWTNYMLVGVGMLIGIVIGGVLLGLRL